MRRTAKLILAFVLVFALFGESAAQASGLIVSTTAPRRGRVMAVGGIGCVPSAAITIRIDRHTLLRTNADDQGRFAKVISIPLTTTLGFHKLSARCLQPYPPGSVLVLSRRVLVRRKFFP